MIDLAAFEADCRRDIPLLTAMQLSLVAYDNLQLTLAAPLAPNINNKGTAFGGSIASICLFGGWAVSTLAFAERGIADTEIVVYSSEMIFERPARGHLLVKAGPEPERFGTCVEALATGSDERLRFDVDVEVFHDAVRCARMRGVYVVWRR
jgi:thioesterase domain-containing protein